MVFKTSDKTLKHTGGRRNCRGLCFLIFGGNRKLSLLRSFRYLSQAASCTRARGHGGAVLDFRAQSCCRVNYCSQTIVLR